MPDGEVPVVNGVGDLPTEVEPARARGALVDPLQERDIRVVMAQNRDDGFRAEPSVDTDCPMDVVGHDASLH